MKPLTWTRAGVRTAAFLAVTGILVPTAILFAPLGGAPRRGVHKLWFAACCGLVGLRLQIVGRPAATGPVLMVANHVSYLDIIALGRLLDAAFVAKAEVATWPLFGIIAKLGRTVFVKRTARHAHTQRNELARRLLGGERMILFPEGTSTDGRGVLPFKSALFAAAHSDAVKHSLCVQPVAISYLRPNPDSERPEHAPEYAWYGDMELVPHLLDVFKRRGAIIKIQFLEPVLASEFEHRKDLARHCEAAVREAVESTVGETAMQRSVAAITAVADREDATAA